MSVEHVQNHVAPSVEVAEVSRWARRYATSALVPKDLKVFKPGSDGKKSGGLDIEATALAIELVVHKGNALGLSPAIAIDAFNVIEGSVVPKARTVLSAVEKAGFRVWWPEYGRERVTVAARRPDAGPEETTRVTFTIEDARDAGLLDEVYERWEQSGNKSYPIRWVVGSTPQPPDWVVKLQSQGVQPKRRENWFKWRTDMLVARASVRIGRLLATYELSGGLRTIVDALEAAEEAEEAELSPANYEHPTEADAVDAEVVVAATADPANDLKVQAAELSAELGLDPAAKAAVCTFAANTTKPTTVDDLTRVVETLKRIQADELILDFSDGLNEYVILAGSGEQWGEDQ